MNLKTLIPSALLLLAAIGGSQKESIRWRWHDVPVIGDPEHKGERLQFGLRSDGVVVWREILNSTNSPAEKEETPGWVTNIWFDSTHTNIIYLTNHFVPWRDFPSTNGVPSPGWHDDPNFSPTNLFNLRVTP